MYDEFDEYDSYDSYDDDETDNEYDDPFLINEDRDFNISFTEEQYTEIARLAAHCGISVKELIFYRLFGSTEI